MAASIASCSGPLLGLRFGDKRVESLGSREVLSCQAAVEGSVLGGLLFCRFKCWSSSLPAVGPIHRCVPHQKPVGVGATGGAFGSEQLVFGRTVHTVESIHPAGLLVHFVDAAVFGLGTATSDPAAPYAEP